MEQQPTTSRNYQSEDTWSRTTSLRGFPIDELRSVLQKSIRRGNVEEAAIAAFEFFSSGPDAEEVMWRRLEIIATEDVGLGMPTAPAVIESLYKQAGRMADPGDRWIYCAHAVRLLATAPKDNMSMELSGWTRGVVESGERSVLVEDFMVDLHTRRGVGMGRTAAHWWENGAKLLNRIPGYDSKWGDYLRKKVGANVKNEE